MRIGQVKCRPATLCTDRTTGTVGTVVSALKQDTSTL